LFYDRRKRVRRSIGGLLLLALVLVASADAAPFQLVGDTRPRDLAWTHAAQVPLPPATITLLRNRDPMYDPGSNTAMIPQAGKLGRTYADERLLLLHELGHAFDYTLMKPGDRARFRKLARTTCRWWQDPCSTPNVRCGCGQILNVPPGEMFAEAYAALALGLTRAQVDDGGLPTYGWNPPEGAEVAIRALIEEIAARQQKLLPTPS